MKDSQHACVCVYVSVKYIKESNERFSTVLIAGAISKLSISRRVMKDSRLLLCISRYWVSASILWE